MERDINRIELTTDFSETSQKLEGVFGEFGYSLSEDIYEINEFLKNFDPNLPPSGETDFEPIFKKIISLDESIKWRPYRKEFMTYTKYQRKKVFCSLYGPEDIQLYLTSGQNGLDYKVYDGQKVSDLYRKLSLGQLFT